MVFKEFLENVEVVGDLKSSGDIWSDTGSVKAANDFDATKNYQQGVLVHFNDKLFLASKDIAAGNDPDSTTDWKELTFNEGNEPKSFIKKVTVTGKAHHLVGGTYANFTLPAGLFSSMPIIFVTDAAAVIGNYPPINVVVDYQWSTTTSIQVLFSPDWTGGRNISVFAMEAR